MVKEQKSTEQRLRLLDLYRFATRKEKALNMIGLVLCMVAGITMPLITLVFGELIDLFALWTGQAFPGQLLTADQLADNVAQKSLFFVYLAILNYFCNYCYVSFYVYTAEKSGHRIRNLYLKSVLRQNISWFDNVGAGEIATRITSDTLLVQDGMGEKVPMAISLMFTFLGGFAIAFYRSWLLTLVLLSVIPFIALSVGFMNVLNSKFQTLIQDQYSKSGNVAEESISAIRTVASFNGQEKIAKKYSDGLAGARIQGMKKSFSTGIGAGSLFLFLYLAYSLAFWYGGIMLDRNEITPGIVVNVFFAVLIGAFSLGQIAPDMQAISFGTAAAKKIFETIDRIPEIDSANFDKKNIDKSTLKCRIEFSNVSFTYPTRPDVPILHSLSFVVEPGTSLALVGESGSGKSTVVTLLERFYDVAGGEISLDGVPIREFNLHSLRSAIGLVSQEPVLFEGTIAENVAMGLPNAKDMDNNALVAKIHEACKQANAHDFIQKLPQGYDTSVGERGMLLSGGQKQRIAIARAIIKDPAILLLDEATSALDTTSERIVQEALDRVSKSRTTISIAHRLSTIKHSDKILVMVKGEVVESGNHSTLVANRGLYAKLVEAQDLHNEKTAGNVQKQEMDVDKVELSTAGVGRASNAKEMEMGTIKGQSAMDIVITIMRLNSPELKFTITGFLAALLSGLINPAFALIFAEIIQTFSKKGAQLQKDTQIWSLAFVGVAVFAFITGFLQNAMFGIASEKLTERIRKTAFKSILRQDIAFFDGDQNSTGILTSNLSSDAQKVQGVSGATIGTVLQMISNLLGSIVISLIYGWKLALVAIAALPLLVFTGAMRLKIITFFSERNKFAYAKSSQVACEAAAAVRTVQSLCQEESVYEKYVQILEKPKKDGIRNAFVSTHMYAASQSINYLVNGLIFWYGGRLMAYEGYLVKNFFTVFTAIVIGSSGLGRIFSTVPDLKNARDAGVNILRLMKRQPLIDIDSKEGLPADNMQGSISFQNVVFKYPTRPDITVLNGLDLHVKPGQFVALVGESGCGKSTTVGLLSRFYDVTGGKLFIDNQPIFSYNLKSFRQKVGLVSQEPNLFDMSIRENIAFGCDFVPTDDDIFAAAKEANIHDFVQSLPQRYDTSVGQKGGQLSGGQKQRIAIARALIKKPKILLLDESTSALDVESEKVVQKALDDAVKGRTTVAIAHRLSSIQGADVIYVFKDGKVAEYGNHGELMALKGLYYELAVQQDLT